MSKEPGLIVACTTWISGTVDAVKAMQALANFKDNAGNAKPVICLDDYYEATNKYLERTNNGKADDMNAVTVFVVMALLEIPCE